MASGHGFIEKSQKVRYNGRITSFFMLSCFIAATGGILFGYDLGSSGGVSSMEPFLKKFFPDVYTKMRANTGVSNYCKFDSQLLTAFTSSLYIASLFASFVAAWVTRALGRKASMLAGGAAFLAGAGLGSSAINVYMLILGRILLGVGIGFSNQSVPLYLSELPLPQYRGAINNGFTLCAGIGGLFANLVNFGTRKILWGWRISLAVAVVPAISFILGSLFLPETPNSLIQRGATLEKVKQMLQKIRGTEEVQEELNDLILANTVPKATDHPSGQFQMIMQQKYRPQLVMAFAIPLFQQLTGINVLIFYAPILYRTIGMNESASLLSAAVLVLISVSSNVITIFVVDRLGRRKILIAGGVQMLVSSVIIWITTAMQLKDHGGMSKGYAYLILVSTGTFVAGFGFSWGPLAWLVPSEIFPLEIRSTLQGIVVAVGFLFNFVFAQVLLAMLCHLKSWTFFFFGGWVFVMTVFVYLLLPETKNVPIEQMDRIWGEHWFWKRFVNDGATEEKMSQMSITNQGL